MAAIAIVLCGAARAGAGSAVGDAGHYLACDTRVFLLNASGEAFAVSLHRFPWWIGDGWNRKDIKVRLTDPAGKIVLEKLCIVEDGGHRLDVPAGAAGVYALDVFPGNGLNYWYVTSTLDRAVAWTGPLEGDAIDARWFLANPFVPRRWWFWVPAETRAFTVRTQNNQARSQREDHGLTIFSPRGQRIAVLWGQANPDVPPTRLGKVQRRIQQAEVLVEPGSAGRFWAIEVRMGDSHTYSDVNFGLDGVPPYVARCPEEWFDANTGRPAPVRPYDESQFVQSDRDANAPNKQFQHWTPCPSMGDADSCEIRCPSRLALWNPAGRALKLVLGTYLPRNLFLPVPPGERTSPRATDDQLDHAAITLTGPDGKVLLQDTAPLRHLHDGPRGYTRLLETPKGVCLLDVERAEHFWTYTYPATPAVMVGREIDAGWRRFHFEIGTARNWYFLVPRGLKAFSVRASAAHKDDVMRLEINAPDRTLAVIYDNAGQKTVAVPAGLDGRIWHVRLDFGSATRFTPQPGPPRFPSLDVTLDLQGVPPYLAPTWEQWFDPASPAPPMRRDAK